MEFIAANNFIVTLIVIMVGLVVGILWIDHKRQSARMQYEQRIEGLEREHDKLVAMREAEQEGRKAEIQGQMRQAAAIQAKLCRALWLFRQKPRAYLDAGDVMEFIQVGDVEALSGEWRERLETGSFPA